MWEYTPYNTPYILVVARWELRTFVLFMRYFCGLLLVSYFALINSKLESDELVIATLISLGSVFICFCFAGINFKKAFSTQCTLHQCTSVWTLLLALHNLTTGGGCCVMVHWYWSDKVTKCQKLWECQMCLFIWELQYVCADGNYGAAV